MNIQITKLYAALVGALGVAGLLTNGHLFELMNVDAALDGLRILLAGFLAYAGLIAKSEGLANLGLNIVGALYIGMAMIGLLSPTLGGLLPSGLTGFDIAFHLITGGLALYLGVHHKTTVRAGVRT